VPDPLPQIWFGLLGPVSVTVDGAPVPLSAARQRTLLAALLLKAGHAVDSEDLADQIWDDEPPAAAASTLRSHVLRLRRALGPVVGERIRTRPPGYLIELQGEAELDLLQFGVLRRRAQEAAARRDWAAAATYLREALGLWRGPALDDVPAGRLRDRELPSLQEGWIQAHERLARADLELGRPDEVLELIMRVQAEHPYREQLSCLLMRAQVATGRTAEALAEYARLRRTLVADLGVEPGEQSRALQAAILASSPIPDWPGEGPAGSTGHAGSTAAPLASSTPFTPFTPPTLHRPTPHQLPGTPRHFVGRTAHLRALTEMVDSATPGATVIAAIGGLAGTGKTALALHWAWQMADRFPDGQLYVNLRGFDPSLTPVAPAEAVRGFLDALGVGPAHLPVSLQAQVALYRSLLADKRVLVVLDNARDDEHVRLLLPGGPLCLVVVTSRTQLTGLAAAEGAQLRTLGPLTADESRELLARHLGRARTSAQPAAVEELISRCAGLALATSIVAARAAAYPQHSLTAAAAQLRDACGRLDVLETGDPATDPRSVFSWSYRHLSEPAARLFRLLGVHPGPDISLPAAASLAGVPLREARSAMAELARAHLVTEHVPGRFESHDLVRAYAQELAEEADTKEDRHAAVHRYMDHYLHALHHSTGLLDRPMSNIHPAPPCPGVTLDQPGTDVEALEWCDVSQRVLMAVVDASVQTGFDTYTWQLAGLLAVFFDQRGRWQNMADAQQTALLAAERLGDRFAQARAHRILGYAHGRMGNYETAEEHLLAAVAIFETFAFKGSMSQSRQGLAWVLEMQGKYQEALAQAELSLALMETSPAMSDRASSLNVVGRCHARLGDYQDGISECRQALDLFKQTDNAMGRAETCYSLGLAYQWSGDQAAALGMFREALDLFYRFGDRHYIGESLTGMADAHAALGDRAAAVDLWRRALAILADIRHPDAERVRESLREAQSHHGQSPRPPEPGTSEGLEEDEAKAKPVKPAAIISRSRSLR